MVLRGWGMRNPLLLMLREKRNNRQSPGAKRGSSMVQVHRHCWFLYVYVRYTGPPDGDVQAMFEHLSVSVNEFLEEFSLGIVKPVMSMALPVWVGNTQFTEGPSRTRGWEKGSFIVLAKA